MTSIVAIAALSDCARSLPTSQRLTRSTWASFDDAKAAYDKVVPGQTTVAALRALGIDPYANANITVLSYLDISRRFLAGDAVRLDQLPASVRACIEAQDACSGYEIALQHIYRERKGNTLADLLNFRRETYETGWTFNGLFVLHDGLVVYKLWSGMPKIDRWLGTDNPLGPVQEPADIIKRQLP